MHVCFAAVVMIGLAIQPSSTSVPSATPTASSEEQRDSGQSAEQTPATKRESLAEELIKLMNVKSLVSELVDARIEQDPSMRPYRDILLEFQEKIWTETLMAKIVAIYTRSFTASELETLIAFYRTPVGRKMVKLTPEFMRCGEASSREAMEAHGEELARMIRKRRDELEKAHTEP
jgi:hypothetical protein